MLEALLGFLGLGASVVCGPELVDQRNQHLDALVVQVQKIAELGEDPKFDYPFKLRGKRMRLSEKWPSPIYSRFRPGLCEIIFNDTESTHAAYEELMARVETQKPEMLKQAEFYVVGHEIGHCVYSHLVSIGSPDVNVAFQRDDQHPDAHPDSRRVTPPPQTITQADRTLHAEIFADVYAIQFAQSMLGTQAVGLEEVVLKFRQTMSANDPSHYTQHYLKSCTEGQLDAVDALVNREDVIPVGAR